jgi:transcriptional accessory protein Tex/SPT6
MANYYVSNPIDVVRVGERVKVRVLEIDMEREKVSLSMKDPSQQQTPTYKSHPKPQESERKTFDDETSSIRSNITFS